MNRALVILAARKIADPTRTVSDTAEYNGAMPNGFIARNGNFAEQDMSDRDDRQAPITETTTEARAGSTPHVTRYVLSVGLILVVVIFAIIVLVGRA